ncbi:TauD/TfdA dioxygenase family protein [Paenibacillus pini]|uniref:Alpha-ketoglutarate-dependent sulfate ester dioxygenase n=1 Tax=Paenibacillus pini JCM 16418 TaxID=1236976 RepID=W7YL20_9BACL|nr:TauD/TfdA family dioxygenase [Paenibacillus pini]GAF08423.1 alpha-ketoglutarate-dependent taurine dioxygenase [Paenibacillus pini JCM 16418]
MSKALKIAPVAGRIGAVIKDIHLSGDLDLGTIQAIEEALLKYKVLFFRGQQHLDDASQEAFAKRLGQLYSHPTVPVKSGTSAVLELDSEHGGRANSWHTDISFVAAYPKASVLRSVVIPAAGGDTVWANTASAYLDLPEELRELVDKLRAEHTNAFDYASFAYNQKLRNDPAFLKYRKQFESTVYETEHPLVRVHPETGEKNLLLGSFVKRIVGFKPDDSARLLSILQDHVTRLENTVRWSWKVGDVVIWDNRATQHYAINDYGSEHRVVRRVTIAGDIPFGVDGRQSVTIKPEPAQAEDTPEAI